MDFIYSSVAIIVLGACFIMSVKKMQKGINFEISNLIQQFQEFFQLCDRQYVAPIEWEPRNDNLAKCFENYFDGDSEEILKEPLLKYFETLKKSAAKLKNFLDLLFFRICGVFIIVLILRIGLAVAASRESEWNFTFSLCISLLATLGVSGFLIWIGSRVQKLLNSKIVISRILDAREDESLLLTACLAGNPYDVHVKARQNKVIEENNMLFLRGFAYLHDAMPVCVFLFFSLLSVCFLFYPILDMMQELG